MADSPQLPELVYWAGNSAPYDLLSLTDAVEPGGYGAFSCFVAGLLEWRDGGRTIAELRRELDDRGVRLNTVDPYIGWYPGFDPADLGAEVAEHMGPQLGVSEDEILNWTAELGATYISVLGPFEEPGAAPGAAPPFDEVVERLGAFTDRAAELGLRPHLEIIPETRIGDLSTALALIDAVGRPNLGLVLDTYNLSRAGVTPDELDAVPHELVFQIQLADAALEKVGSGYFEDGLANRMFAGEGELPVAEMVRRLLAKGPLPPTGSEVFNPELHALTPSVAGPLCADTTRAFLGGIATAG